MIVPLTLFLLAQTNKGPDLPAGIDSSRPHAARIYDYFLGGTNNFAADRAAAAEVLRNSPSVRTAARENRAFLFRAVRYLAAEAGIRQFLDIGTGLPAAGSVHETAQRADPSSRVVYADNDPQVIAQNDKVVSVNAALQVDLTGAVNAEHLLGHQYSATGGQLDFVRGAYASRGGKSIIACLSTAAKGKVSRIVARLEGPVTTPRTDTQFVVTEFGWTDLKGKSSTERAKALIALSHPAFRDELTAAAKEMHLL